MRSPANGITAVLYTGAVIESAILRQEGLDGASAELHLNRDTLLQTVRESGPLATLHQHPNGVWEIVDKIDLITVDGAEYLKWVNDGYACDDLGDFPQP